MVVSDEEGLEEEASLGGAVGFRLHIIKPSTPSRPARPRPSTQDRDDHRRTGRQPADCRRSSSRRDIDWLAQSAILPAPSTTRNSSVSCSPKTPSRTSTTNAVDVGTASLVAAVRLEYKRCAPQVLQLAPTGIGSGPRHHRRLADSDGREPVRPVGSLQWGPSRHFPQRAGASCVLPSPRQHRSGCHYAAAGAGRHALCSDRVIVRLAKQRWTTIRAVPPSSRRACAGATWRLRRRASRATM